MFSSGPILMHDIARFREGAFNPEAMETLTKAFAEALDILGPDGATAEQKAGLAKHLMDLARSGEMDETRLASMAVLRVLGRDPTSPAG